MSPKFIALPLIYFEEFSGFFGPQSVIIYSRRHADGKKLLAESLLMLSDLSVFLFLPKLCFNDFDSSSDHQQNETHLAVEKRLREKKRTPKVQ